MSFLYSIVRDDLILHPGYPVQIIVPHSMVALSSFRASFAADDWVKVPFAMKLVGGWFCHAFGGSTTRDLVLGNAPNLITSPNIHRWWALSVGLVYFSPGDLVHRWLQTPLHPVRVVLRFVEMIDAYTTIAGTFEKGVKLYPNSEFGPYCLAIVTSLGGSIVRYLERRIGGWKRETKTEWGQPTGSLQKNIGFVILYSILRRPTVMGVKGARMTMVLWCCFMEVLADFYRHHGKSLPSGPLAAVVTAVCRRLASLASFLRLGFYKDYAYDATTGATVKRRRIKAE